MHSVFSALLGRLMARPQATAFSQGWAMRCRKAAVVANGDDEQVLGGFREGLCSDGAMVGRGVTETQSEVAPNTRANHAGALVSAGLGKDGAPANRFVPPPRSRAAAANQAGRVKPAACAPGGSDGVLPAAAQTASTFSR